VTAWINSLPHNSATLPKGWSHRDVGPVGVKGDASFLNNQYNLIASGTDIWQYVDGFHYAYTTMKGDGQIVARVISMQYTDPWAKAGVMFRQDMSPDSKHVMMVVTAGGFSSYQWRPTRGQWTHNTDGPTTTTPYWVKLVRKGNLFMGYISPDGTDWKRIDSITVPLPDKLYVGLVVSSHDNTSLNSVMFDNVSLSAAQ
jgi:regulation of enolase protein 1 (concanavalin A-like superfamily)